MLDQFLNNPIVLGLLLGLLTLIVVSVIVYAKKSQKISQLRESFEHNLRRFRKFLYSFLISLTLLAVLYFVCLILGSTDLFHVRGIL